MTLPIESQPSVFSKLAATFRNRGRGAPAIGPEAPADASTPATPAGQAIDVDKLLLPTAATPAEAQAPAEPIVAAAPTFELAPTTERLRSMAVIVGHSNSQVAKILTGVIGEINEDKFTMDPAYAEISYLFTLYPHGEVDVDGAQYEVVPMLESDVGAFRATMIRGSGDSWDQMYQAVSTAAPTDIVARMLAAERVKVGANVAAYVARQGLTEMLVPVVARVQIPQASSGEVDAGLADPTWRASEAALIAGGVMQLPTLQIDVNKDVVPATTAAAAIVAEGYAPAPLSDENRQHRGAFDLTVQTTVPILATSGDQAMRVMMNVMAISRRNMDMVRNVLTCGPSSIQNAVLVPYDAYYDDEGDSGYGDDDRDRGG